jgi:hypothetical protein
MEGFMMIDDASPKRPAGKPSLKYVELSKKIGWICQSVRFAAVGYALWVIYHLATYWSDASAISESYGRLLHSDISGVEAWQQAAAFGVSFVVWLFAAYACYSAWRLFSAYLKGAIFALEATQWLRRLALYGLASQALSILTRPLISVLLTLHFPAGQKLRIVNIFFQPNDLSTLLLLFGLLALAHIQRTAVEIADDHAQIV